MFKNITYGSKQEHDENIDMCSVQENCAWVIDGANGLFQAHISDAESDADWLVKELHTYLKKHLMMDGLPISDIMKLAMIDVTSRFKQFPGYHELYDMNMPSAACAVICVQGKNISYFVLGNCELILHYDDGNVITISDLRLQELDGKILEISQDAKKKRRLPMYQAKRFMDQMMVENRLRRNMENGYYVIGEDASSADHAITGTVPIDHIKSICLMCNGFSQYFRCKKVMQNLDQYIEKTRNPLLVETYDELLARQEKSTSVAHFMQQKLSGQSTIVTFDVDTSLLLLNKKVKQRN